jgi:hypothetical protein
LRVARPPFAGEAAVNLDAIVGGIEDAAFTRSAQVEDSRSMWTRWLDDNAWAQPAANHLSSAWNSAFGGNAADPVLARVSALDGHRTRYVPCPELPERYEGDLPSQLGLDDIPPAPRQRCTEVVWGSDAVAPDIEDADVGN